MTDKSNNPSELRVLLVAPYPPPYGGIASLVVSLIQGLLGLGIENIAVVTFGDKNSREIVPGATIYRISMIKKKLLGKLFLIKNWSSIIATIWALKFNKLGLKGLLEEILKTITINQIAKTHQSNLVAFYQSDLSLELIACNKLWRNKRKIVLTIFGEFYDNPDFFKERVDLFKQLVDIPKAVMSSSKHCAQSLKSIGIDREIKVNYVGVDLQRFADDGILRKSFRDQLKLTDNTKLLVFMGRFAPEMGLDSLIEMIPSILSKNENLKIVLAGARGMLSSLAEECQEKYPANVILMNNIPFNLQPALYAASDIVLTPSRDQHACMGVTIKEAMAASRPVIGSDSGGIPEAIVHNETGLIVPLEMDGDIDKNAFIAAIQSLLDNPGKCKEMGNKARLRASELFSDVATVKRTAETFLKCINHE